MLKRQKHKMPLDIKSALIGNKVLDDYNSRPPYQQNDYIGWITSAKLIVTRTKRFEQMIKELKIGGVYMNMKHPASSKHQKK